MMSSSKEAASAADFLPQTSSLKTLAEAAEECQGCPLYRGATQTVFGAGRKSSRLVLVGEQPGDEEDRQGKPFVGPAGRLLNDCLDEAGIDRELVYVTNAVKHFKFESKGKRRLHKKPSSREVKACRPWLERELELISPDVVICLGATAAHSLLGPNVRVTKQRGEWLSSTWCEKTLVTYHPSAILRAPDESNRHELRGLFVADLTMAGRELNT